jgi:hypothetical protein
MQAAAMRRVRAATEDKAAHERELQHVKAQLADITRELDQIHEAAASERTPGRLAKAEADCKDKDLAIAMLQCALVAASA